MDVLGDVVGLGWAKAEFTEGVFEGDFPKADGADEDVVVCVFKGGANFGRELAWRV